MEQNKNEALSAKEKYQTAVESASDYIEHFDLLETITNVGNDEVFTPRKTCNVLLDILPEEVWHNPNYKWLNPATKNGIFEREIALRLDEGLKDVIPDEETRRKHILQNMIYSIGQTKFTSNVARRTLYYCSQANRKCDGIKADDGHYVNGYAIGNGTWFDTEEGNIYTPKVEHWYEGKGKNRKCKFCGISEDSKYNDALQREHYAYEFIHYKSHHLQYEFRKMFFKGDANMKFDIIIGNPPYQLSDGGAQASASPIYQKFIEQAIQLNPKYLSMIVPSRWFSGGKGLDDFRMQMLRDKHLAEIHDFPNASDCFPTVEIKGGVNYFLWTKDSSDDCLIFTHSGNKIVSKAKRPLLEKGCDVFIRNNELVSIFRKVSAFGEKSFSEIVSPLKPYGLRGDFFKDPSKYSLPPVAAEPIDGGLKIHGLENMKRVTKYIDKNYPLPRKDYVNGYKMFMARNQGSGLFGETFSVPVFAGPNECCTETFVVIGTFKTQEEMNNCWKYMTTKFFRAMVGVKKNDQGMAQGVYQYVPMQDFSKSWTDEELYKKYKLSKEEIDFIEQNVKPFDSVESQAESGDDDE